MALELTDRQKVAHLLRRFGFGASLADMARFEGLSPKQAMAKLLDFKDAKDLGDPMRFAFKADKPEDDAEPGGYRFRLHWILQMVTTEHPLREKLALFWHDHFACNEEDVAHGLAMLDYMGRLRDNPAGKFREILDKMGKSTAVMRQLNVEMYSKAKPNENFARELMELYTMGVGNYTEQDVKEIAKAMTGWGLMDVFWRLGDTNKTRLSSMEQYDNPAIFNFYAPAAHIEGKKPILGKQLDTLDDVLDLLATHPVTAKAISKKLWEFFAYMDPEPKVIERLAGRFVKSGGSIAETLTEMSEMPEFWSETCYRNLIKNPVDYTVGICRAQNAGAKYREVFNDGKFNEPVKQEILDQLGGIQYRLNLTGMDLFFPPNVAGWDWGPGWISTNTLMRRREFTGTYTYYPVEKDGKKEWLPDKPMMYVVEEMRKRNPADTDAFTNAFLLFYDCPLSPEKQEVLNQHFEKMQVVKNLANDRHVAWVCTTALQLLGSAPEFQLC